MTNKPLDTKYYRSALKQIYFGPQILIVLILFGLSCWGIIDSFHDAGGERLLGAIPIAAPGILALWFTLTILWRKEKDMELIVRQFLFAGLVSALPLIAVNLLSLLAAWMVPANQILVTGNESVYYWWDGSIGMQLLLVGLGSFASQLCGALIAMTIIVLPILSLKDPQIAAQGSHLEKVADERVRNRLTIFLYCGLSSFIIGLILVISTEGFDLSMLRSRLELIFSTWRQYGRLGLPGSWILWLIGLFLSLIGIVLIIWACIYVVNARRKNSR